MGFWPLKLESAESPSYTFSPVDVGTESVKGSSGAAIIGYKSGAKIEDYTIAAVQASQRITHDGTVKTLTATSALPIVLAISKLLNQSQPTI